MPWVVLYRPNQIVGPFTTEYDAEKFRSKIEKLQLGRGEVINILTPCLFVEKELEIPWNTIRET